MYLSIPLLLLCGKHEEWIFGTALMAVVVITTVEHKTKMTEDTPTSQVPLKNYKVISHFEYKEDFSARNYRDSPTNSIRTISLCKDGTSWIATYDAPKIKHIDQAGNIIKSITLSTKISDVTITDNGSLLVTPNGGSGGNEFEVKMICPNGDIVTFVNMKPLRPGGIQVSRSGSVYIGYVDEVSYKIKDDSCRCLVKHSADGNVQERFEFDENKERLFTSPDKICENTNGDIWINDRTDYNKGRIVILSNDGKLRTIYKGIENDATRREFIPGDITLCGNGHMLMTDIYNSMIHMLDEQGRLLCLLAPETGTGITIMSPAAICMNPAANLIWVGTSRGQIYILQLYTK